MKFKYEVPSINRKQEAIDFINEFYENNSKINGVGGLHRYLNDYEGWLSKLEEDYTREANEDNVPARTYFFIRIDDNKIIGMANIRTKLNKEFMDYGGNIGYCIRPSERRNGYNKINLYLALKICKEYKIETALLHAHKDNPASWRTMESLGATLIAEKEAELEECCVIKHYSIDVNKTLETYKNIYEPLIEK